MTVQTGLKFAKKNPTTNKPKELKNKREKKQPKQDKI